MDKIPEKLKSLFPDDFSEAEVVELIQKNYLASLKNQNLFNDELACLAFRNHPELVQSLLRTILEDPHLVVESAVVQDDLRGLNEAKSVRIDILASTADGREIAIELQRIRKALGPERMRMILAMMDRAVIQEGQPPEILPASILVVIFEKADFPDPDPVQSYSWRNDKTFEPLGIGQRILLVDGSWRGEDELGAWMRSMSESDPENIPVKEVQERMRFLKTEEKGETIMFEFNPEFTEKMVEFLVPVVRRRMEEQMQEEIQAEIQAGIQTGKENLAKAMQTEKKNMVKAMLSDGMPAAQIERYTGIPADQIEKLRQEMEA